MAQVYLLDVSYLTRSEECLPFDSSVPPLSWLCAAELAQWTSAAALRDAWAAAETSVAERSEHDATRTPNSASSGQGNRGYTQLGSDDDDDGGGSTDEVCPPCRSLYAIHTFPSTVGIRNKYFSATITLLTGAPLRPLGHQRHACAGEVDPRDVTAEMLRKFVSVRNRRTGSSSSPAHDKEGCAYGGVLLAGIMQNPAHVPWDSIPRSGGQCLFHVVMVFHCDESILKQSGATPTAPTSLQLIKERWNYFAAENGYECIFHTTPCLPPPVTPTEKLSAQSDGCIRNNAAENFTLQRVDIDGGLHGLLEAPLAGSNRLYQLLCNTLWPADVRQTVSLRSGARDSGHHKGESAEALHPLTAPKTRLGNAFVVVGNDEAAMWHLFLQQEDGCAPSPRYHPQFFTSVVELPTHSATAARVTRVALVNRYYAAIVQPRLVQTALFNTNMQDMLERYWELQTTAEGYDDALCLDAPAVVLWPPSSRTTDASQTGTSSGEAVTVRVDTDDEDVRASYPPLEAVLDFLARRGCCEIVVVVREHPDNSALDRLTAHEMLLCAERNVEVVQIGAPPFTTTSAGAIEANNDGSPPPVHRGEDDTKATRGVSRLHELLHCAHWGQTHPMVCTTFPATRPVDRRYNSCLLLTCGQTPFEEEALVRDLLSAMTLAPSAPCRQGATVAADNYLRLAAPTVLAARGTAANSDGNAGLEAGPIQSGIAVDVSTSYFNARVNLYMEGGLQSYYAAPLAQCLGTPSLPPGWDDAHDAYVIITTLNVLQEAARAVVGAARQKTLDGPKIPDTMSRSQATLCTVITTLTRRQKQEWLVKNSDAEVVDASRQGDTDTKCDSPLLLLYITNVMATDTKLVELVEKLVCTIARHAAAPDPIFLGETGNNVVVDEEYALIELVFASGPPIADGGTATSGRCADLVVDGTARVREAFEQHLWPHRQPLPRTHKPHASRIHLTTPTREQATSSQKVVEAQTSSTFDSAAHQEAPAFSSLVTGRPAEVMDVQAEAGTSDVVRKATITNDTRWSAPVIGCALPNGFLVDPETLRSVPVRSIQNNFQTATKTNKVDMSAKRSCSAAPAQPLKPLHGSHCEEELLQWMEKMNRYGHRLDDALRKDQAALISVAFEQLI